MKKLLIIAAILSAILLIAMPSAAQTWHPANQATLAWDPVARIEPTDAIQYQVYSMPAAGGAAQKVGAEIAATQLTASFQQEGRYWLGVQSVRYPQGETAGIPSASISWSSDPAVCQGGAAFGVVYYTAPGNAGGLRLNN